MLRTMHYKRRRRYKVRNNTLRGKTKWIWEKSIFKNVILQFVGKRKKEVVHFCMLRYCRLHYSSKCITMKSTRNISREKQRCALINRNDFAYAGRETVNTGIITFKRIAHSPFKTIANQTYKVAGKRIQEAITQKRKGVARVAPKIIIEELYKTLFCLLGNFGRKTATRLREKLKMMAAKIRRLTLTL